ncbi:hypothetical protein C8Q79DRAFT_1006022 [Trametes meyenii]|nr:hypothetical protein C8Q79DRAFT_1006022 [Trametes meyenii]
MSTVCMTQAVYETIVLDFGQPEKLGGIPWGFGADNGINIITALAFECYFAHRLWYLSRKNIPLVGLILFFGLAGFGLGIELTVHLLIDRTVASLSAPPFRIKAGVFNGCSAVSDALIAAGLCYYLKTSRSGIKRTDNILDKLMIYAINRGALTTIGQVILLITMVALPGHTYFLPFCMMQSKFYVNALLATLNVRDSLIPAGECIDLVPTSLADSSTRQSFYGTPPGATAARSLEPLSFDVSSKREEAMIKTQSTFDAPVA